MPPKASNATSIRNTTTVPIAFVSATDVIVVQPREMVVYPFQTLRKHGLFGLMPVTYTTLELHGYDTDLNMHLQLLGTDVALVEEEELQSDAAAPAPAPVPVTPPSVLRNGTSRKVIVYGTVGDLTLAPTYLPPGASVPVAAPVTTAKLFVISGAAYFTVNPHELENVSDFVGVPLVSFATERTTPERRNMRTYMLVKGQHYEAVDPYTVMLDVITNEDVSVMDLPELKRCETLPSVQLSTSSRVTLVAVVVAVGIVLVAVVALVSSSMARTQKR